jgi:hypothetical protein
VLYFQEKRGVRCGMLFMPWQVIRSGAEVGDVTEGFSYVKHMDEPDGLQPARMRQRARGVECAV